jgi:F-type H+-transporting ATPase subunit b
MLGLLTTPVLAAASPPPSPSAPPSSGSTGNFLVAPSTGPMIWTLIAFFVTLYILRRFAFPRISAALEKRQRIIEESIEQAERTRKQADELLAEYRERLAAARKQADEIVARSRKAAEQHEREAHEAANEAREQLMEHARRDIQQETQRAIQELRNEVADLTILATERVTRKTLDTEDQRRLVEEALGDLDFAKLAAENGQS